MPTPLEKFNEWAKSDHEWIHKTACAYGEMLVRGEFVKMRAWIEANPRKGNKQNYRRFCVNWLNKCQQILIKAVYDSAAVEKASENAKRRWTGTSEMERLDEGTDSV